MANARDVVPPGRRVVDSFVDGATGYEVIAHLPVSQREGTPHITLVDPRTGEVVPVERRAAELSSEERVRIDEANGLRLSTRHTIDLPTGQESLAETLTDLATGRELSKGTASALRRAGDTDDLLTSYLAWRKRESDFAREYATWSFEQRVVHWYEQIWRRMRWQEESGLDAYAMFTPESYAEWRAREPDIDRILDAALLRIESAGTRAEIERRLGRASRPKKPTRRRARR